jgi:hypothetical protein
MLEPSVTQSNPVVLRAEAEQDLGHCQTDQLGIGEPLRASRPPPGVRDDMVVDQHVQCDQEGVEVCSHERPSIPSSLSLINKARRDHPSLGITRRERRRDRLRDSPEPDVGLSENEATRGRGTGITHPMARGPVRMRAHNQAWPARSASPPPRQGPADD